MRQETIHQAISVRADFRGGTATPLAFRRGTRHYRIARVNARWVDRAGRHPQFCFSVTAESGDVYELRLSAADLVWWLDTVTMDA